MKAELDQQLAMCMLHDRVRLSDRITEAVSSGKSTSKRLQQSIDRAVKRRAARLSGLPAIHFNKDLPIHDKLPDIEAALCRHQVIIVCGETGSGKTTQLPQLCLALKRGIDGLIGHTQPRRIAARTVAARLGEELHTPGKSVGFKIRHTDTTNADSYIKVMTDGILLAELQVDRQLLHYDTLIIDEAHERSLNIDFLLGYIRQLLPQRPDLKVIITSATIDVDRFSTHFDKVPIIEVSGRTYPVEVRYRPLPDDSGEEDSEEQALLDAVNELCREGPGDILIFLEGEREIHETARLLGKQQYPDIDVLPLYSRLSASRQARIFKPHKRRHIVLATNVAETSLTIPGIHYVIDRGRARISRYSRRSKVQRLPTEKISRASAKQRTGRCGRVAKGICIRLYSAEDFEARQEFTDAEILRTNLASVILQMKALGLGDIEGFPFIDPPDPRAINDGIRLLRELRALTATNQLTETGKKLACLPVDPRLGRILLAADEYACMTEMLVITSALSIQDPRERPLDMQDKADEKHARFNHERSDFIWFLNLWKFYRLQKKKLSGNRLRKLCKEDFLSHVRMREWEDIHKQLKSLIRELGIRHDSSSEDYNNLHCALLTGFPGHVAQKTGKREYTGARGIKLRIFPGSSQFACLPKWIVAAELVETSRLFARTVAQIDPRWLIRVAPHLVQREYYDPYWDTDSGQVRCLEKTVLYGLTLASNRVVNYGTTDRADARQILIQSAFIEDGPDYGLAFLRYNREVIHEIHTLEAKTRRRDIVDEAALAEFYEEVIPAHVYSIPLLKKWLKKQADEKKLLLDKQAVMKLSPEAVSDHSYPDDLTINNHRLAIGYHFEPGHSRDGISLNVPLHLLNQINNSHLEQLIPGMFRDKITVMLKSLPKHYRRQLVPVPDTAAECAAVLAGKEGPLAFNLADYLLRSRGLEIDPGHFRIEILPEHLQVRLCIIDNEGDVIDEGRDLKQLQTIHANSACSEFSRAFSATGKPEAMTDWEIEEIPESVAINLSGKPVKAYPALVDEQDTVVLRYFDTRETAMKHMHRGLLRLFMLTLKKDVCYLIRHLLHIDEMCLWYAPIDSCDNLKSNLVELVIDQVFLAHQETIRTRTEFEHRKARGIRQLVNKANEICSLVHDILHQHHEIRAELDGLASSNTACRDIQEQLTHLVYRDFLIDTDYEWLQHYPRYMEAIRRRLEKLVYDPARDEKKLSELRPFWETCKKLVKSSRRSGNLSGELRRYRWMVEEYRISLFAQEQKTVIPVSSKRLRKQLDNIKRESAWDDSARFDKAL